MSKKLRIFVWFAAGGVSRCGVSTSSHDSRFTEKQRTLLFDPPAPGAGLFTDCLDRLDPDGAGHAPSRRTRHLRQCDGCLAQTEARCQAGGARCLWIFRCSSQVARPSAGVSAGSGEASRGIRHGKGYLLLRRRAADLLYAASRAVHAALSRGQPPRRWWARATCARSLSRCDVERSDTQKSAAAGSSIPAAALFFDDGPSCRSQPGAVARSRSASHDPRRRR